MEITCELCGDTLPKDEALLDAKWMSYTIQKQMRYMCRDCAKMVAESVIAGY